MRFRHDPYAKYWLVAFVAMLGLDLGFYLLCMGWLK